MRCALHRRLIRPTLLLAGLAAAVPDAVSAAPLPPAEVQVEPPRLSVVAGDASAPAVLSVEFATEPEVRGFSFVADLPPVLGETVRTDPSPIQVEIARGFPPRGEARLRFLTEPETPPGTYRVMLRTRDGALRAAVSLVVRPRREPDPQPEPEPRPPPAPPPPPPEPEPQPRPEPEPEPEPEPRPPPAPPPPPPEPEPDPRPEPEPEPERGELEATLEPDELELCAGGAPERAVLRLRPRDGYRGTAVLSWGTVPPGLELTPRRLGRIDVPPARELGLALTASDARPHGKTVTVEVRDPARGTARELSLGLSVAEPGFGVEAIPAEALVRQGAPRSAVTVRLLPNRCFQDGPVRLRVTDAPEGLLVEPRSATLGPPDYRATLELRAPPTLPTGGYRLELSLVPTRGPQRTASVPIRIEAPGPGELLRTPRIDRVDPAELLPGSPATLTLHGRNLRPGTTVSFGAGVQLLGAPYFSSEREGRVQVYVTPDARPGRRVARATNADGAAEGPGAVLVHPRRPPPDGPPPRAAAPEPEDQPPPPRVDGPRVDRIVPDRLMPGLTYTVALWGRNLGPETSLDLGPGVALVGGLRLDRPWSGAARLRVAPDAEPGERLVTASDARGSNRGPAGVLVEDGVPDSPPGELPFQELPSGEIELLQPFAPNRAGCRGSRCGPPTLRSTTLFSWRESNPGLSDHYLLEIVDGDGEVLASAQVAEESYRAGPALLATLRGASAAELSGDGTRWQPDGGGGAPAAVAADPEYATFDTGWQDDPDVAWWRVTGYWRDPEGTPVQVARSEPRGLRLPGAPRGLTDCSTASSILEVAQVRPSPGETLSPECQAPGTICAGSEVDLSGRLDLSRSPYDPLPDPSALQAAWQPPGHPQRPPAVLLRNVWIDWGDGTAPRPLQTGIPGLQDLAAVPLGAGRGGAPGHVYPEPGSYTVKVYSLAEPEGDYAGVVAPSLQGGAAAFPIGGSPAAAWSGAEGVLVREGGLDDAYLFACTTLRVDASADHRSDGPLDLVSAEIVWPGPYAEQEPPQVSECAESFRPRVRIVYSGTGRVRLSWYGSAYLPLAVSEPSEPLPPVSALEAAAGSKPAELEMTVPLPLFARDDPYSLRVEVETLDAAEDPGLALAPGGSDPLPGIGTIVNAAGPSGPPVVSPVLVTDAPERTNGVTSPTREYRVIPAPDDTPCRLVYETEESGTLHVTDLFLDEVEGDVISGAGTLKLLFPDGAGGWEPRYVPLAFQGWQVAPGAGGGDWPVLQGAAEVEPAVWLTVGQFEVEVEELSLTPERAALSGRVALTSAQGLAPAGPGGTLPSFDFDGAVVEPEGGFYAVVESAGAVAALGASGFELELGRVALDFSVSRGTPTAAAGSLQPGGIGLLGNPGDAGSGDGGESAAVSGCAPATGGTGWIGVLVEEGLLRLPGVGLAGESFALGSIEVGPWALGSDGLDADLSLDLGSVLQKGLTLGSVSVELGGLDVGLCGGSLEAALKVELEGLPIIEKSFPFLLRFGDGGLLATVPYSLDLTRDYEVVRLSIQDLSLVPDPELGGWAVALDGSVDLRLASKTVFSQEIHGLRLDFAGGVHPPEAAETWFAVDAGWADLAGFGVQVEEMGIGFEGSSAWFGLSGGLELGASFALEATNLRFHLERQDLQFEPAGVTVDEISLEAGFPAAQPMARLTASVGWHAAGGDYSFRGEGGLQVTGADLGVGAQFLFGRSGGSSYWMGRLDVDLPAGVPVGPVPISFYGFAGGLGYNVGQDAFHLPLEQVAYQAGTGLSLLAGVSMASSDGYYVWVDGSLTIGFSGPGKGFRVDADAWVLSHDRPEPAPLQACLKLAGSEFNLSAGMDLKLLGGVARLLAPSGPDPCSDPNSAIDVFFGPGGSNWHVFLGRQEAPIEARMYGRETTGYLQLQPGSLWLGGTLKNGFGPYTLGTECWNVHASGHLELGAHFALQVQPVHIYGAFEGAAELEIGGCAFCECGSWNPGFGLKVHAEAVNPTDLCIDELWLKGLPVKGDVTLVKNVCIF